MPQRAYPTDALSLKRYNRDVEAPVLLPPFLLPLLLLLLSPPSAHAEELVPLDLAAAADVSSGALSLTGGLYMIQRGALPVTRIAVEGHGPADTILLLPEDTLEVERGKCCNSQRHVGA